MTTIHIQQSPLAGRYGWLSGGQKSQIQIPDTPKTGSAPSTAGTADTIRQALEAVTAPRDGFRIALTPTTGLGHAAGAVSAVVPHGQTGNQAAHANALPNLQDLFAHYLQSAHPASPATPPLASQNGGVDKLLENIQSNLNDINAIDPQSGSRLIILLRTIAMLDPKNGRAILQRLSDALQSISALSAANSQQQAATAAQTAPPPPPPSSASPAAAAAPQQPPQAVHITLDFEITSSQTFTSTLAEMRNQGVSVQTTQLETTQTVKIHMEFTGIRQEVQKSDPLVFDLTGNGIQLSGVQNGAAFDINADGKAEQTAFVRGGTAFLALDRNGNGRIDDGGELFGDQHGAKDGLTELAKFDSNHDGVINSHDAIFGKLRMLWDKNGDGHVNSDELSTLTETHIASISLSAATALLQDDRNGNTISGLAEYTRADGSKGTLADAWLANQSTATPSDNAGKSLFA